VLTCAHLFRKFPSALKLLEGRRDILAKWRTTQKGLHGAVDVRAGPYAPPPPHPPTHSPTHPPQVPFFFRYVFLLTFLCYPPPPLCSVYLPGQVKKLPLRDCWEESASPVWAGRKYLWGFSGRGRRLFPFTHTFEPSWRGSTSAPGLGFRPQAMCVQRRSILNWV
jgi:hypothetical protein